MSAAAAAALAGAVETDDAEAEAVVKMSPKEVELAQKDRYHEGLGPDYLRTPFKQPQVELAKAEAASNMFQQGKGSVLGTSIEDFEVLGVGVVVYFRVLSILAWTFTIMTVAYLPMLLAYSSGDGVDEEYLGSLKLITTTIANLPALNQSETNQFIDVFGANVKSTSLLGWVSLCDTIALIIFVIAFYRIAAVIRKTEQTVGRDVSASRYAVYCTGIPSDATEDEIRDHFSKLYDLDAELQEQQQQQQPLDLQVQVEGGAPSEAGSSGRSSPGPGSAGRSTFVDRYETKNDQPYDVAVQEGRVTDVETGKTRQSHAARARIKRARYQRSIVHMAAQGQLDFMTHTDVQQCGEGVNRSIANASFLEIIRPKPVLDTTFPGSSKYLNSWVAEVSVVKPIGDRLRFYLKTQGLSQQLTLARARAKYYAVQLRNAIKEQKQRQGQSSTGGRPSSANFNRPSLGVGSAADHISDTDSNLELAIATVKEGDMQERPSMLDLTQSARVTRAQHNLRAATDEVDRLERLIGSVADRWRRKLIRRTKDVQTLLAEKKNLDSTVGAFIIFNNRKSQQRCLDEYAGSSTWFGRLSQKRQLRFRGITPISVTEAPEPADIRWENLDASLWERLARTFGVDILIGGLLFLAMLMIYAFFGQTSKSDAEVRGVATQDDDEAETDFLLGSEKVNLPTSTAVLFAIILSFILKGMLTGLLQLFHRPRTDSEAENGLATRTFLAEYIVYGVMLLCVSLAEIIDNGLTRVVYVEAGTAIMYASIVWTVLPHLPRWCNYLFINRTRRWYYLLRGEVYTQNQMNQLFQGEPFTLASRYPVILASVFVAMSYAASMPILVPFCAMQLWLAFFSDKFLLVKYHSKPPAYDLKLAWDTWSFLPWALLIHLVGSVFMFGNPSLVPPVTYAKKVTTDENWTIDFFNYRPYIVESEVLSIYALVITIFIAAAFALRVWRGVENSRLARDYIRWLRGRNTSIVRVFDEALRFPQYTNVFYRFLDEKRKLTLQQWEIERRNGYVIHESGFIFRLWTPYNIHMASRPHQLGTELMTTWDSIREPSYRIYASEKYRNVMLTLTNHMNRSFKRLEVELAQLSRMETTRLALATGDIEMGATETENSQANLLAAVVAPTTAAEAQSSNQEEKKEEDAAAPAGTEAAAETTAADGGEAGGKKEEDQAAAAGAAAAATESKAAHGAADGDETKKQQQQQQQQQHDEHGHEEGYDPYSGEEGGSSRRNSYQRDEGEYGRYDYDDASYYEGEPYEDEYHDGQYYDDYYDDNASELYSVDERPSYERRPVDRMPPRHSASGAYGRHHEYREPPPRRGDYERRSAGDVYARDAPRYRGPPGGAPQRRDSRESQRSMQQRSLTARGSGHSVRSAGRHSNDDGEDDRRSVRAPTEYTDAASEYAYGDNDGDDAQSVRSARRSTRRAAPPPEALQGRRAPPPARRVAPQGRGRGRGGRVETKFITSLI